ncbi:MAG: 2,3-bisphosphoglycerate-independent phosphoglycerate mutase [Firmicutes bacterium]|nr:2,3-bisphosphoglycerate-independent phosphoglycerate mutase [Bacillota bacterium]
MKKTNAIVIMDGYGHSSSEYGNAVFHQGSPHITRLKQQYPHTLIKASGLAVGLPEGQMGNSEVGHLNLGAGRTVYQDITRIDKSILDGDFFENPAFLGAIENCKKYNSAMHIVGLASDGGVHSHLNHLYALLKLCKQHNLTKVYIHAITDGRDVPPNSAKYFVQQIEAECKKIGIGKIAVVVGRYYYMDRDNRWERVQKGYEAVFEAVGSKFEEAKSGIEASYKDGILDEFIKPIIVDDYSGVNANDSMIFFNFRSDRAREISRAIIEPNFTEFIRSGGFKSIFYVGLTEYDANFTGIHTAYGPKDITNTLGEFLAKNNLTQARVAETEKYAHVTFFFNGGVEAPNKGEERVLVASPKVATYDLKPEMSAYEVTEKALEQIGKVDVLILNYANCDMVGHTGVFDSAIKAVKTVDECVGKIADKILAVDGNMILTADHGNAEQMYDDKGNPFTAHSTNAVPLVVIGKDFNKDTKLKNNGSLADVAPTLLYLLGLQPPSEMDGKNIIMK